VAAPGQFFDLSCLSGGALQTKVFDLSCLSGGAVALQTKGFDLSCLSGGALQTKGRAAMKQHLHFARACSILISGPGGVIAINILAEPGLLNPILYVDVRQQAME